MTLKNKLIAEFFGTFWLVFGGCGSAVLAAMFLTTGDNPVQLGIGFVGVSLAFGLTVMTMAYAIGHISGCHLNPAVTVGLVVAGRHPKSEMIPYFVAQVIGGIAGAGVLYLIASGKEGFSTAGGFASNGFGLGLTLIHLIGIPVTNLSVNPARSTGPAIFVGGWAIAQLWLFWVAPIIGAALAGIVYPLISGGKNPELNPTAPRPVRGAAFHFPTLPRPLQFLKSALVP